MSVVTVTIKQCDGNESVGTMWEESEIFSIDTPIKEILRWVAKKNPSFRTPISILVPGSSIPDLLHIFSKEDPAPF